MIYLRGLLLHFSPSAPLFPLPLEDSGPPWTESPGRSGDRSALWFPTASDTCVSEAAQMILSIFPIRATQWDITKQGTHPDFWQCYYTNPVIAVEKWSNYPQKIPWWCSNRVKNNITVIIPNKEANRNSKSLRIKTIFHKSVFFYYLL